ncbi:uncharacterized protein L201_001523 [Kwoniella dendrophila CBS 6074]|uniref:BTB domain-containing protein n=1 Tax=Kwoniella dendrophila CBS 6074 TaxID=1295534 RepID=A0AAX4JNK6_9TREE
MPSGTYLPKPKTKRLNAMAKIGHDKPQISSAYNACDADLVLASAGNIEFKVHSYMLKANSSVFRDILCDSAFISSSKPIDVDVSSKNLTYFLDAMYKYPTPTIDTWENAKVVLELCDKYDCEFISVRIRNTLKQVVSQDPWGAFCFASHHDDLKMARRALKGLYNDEERCINTSETISVKDASMPTMPHLLGYFSLDRSNQIYNEQKNRYEPNWFDIGHQFQPRKS